MRKTMETQIYYLATAVAVLLWSASFIATKLAYQSFSPIQLGAVRTLIAVIIFMTVRILRGEKERIEKEDRVAVAASGFLGLTLYFTVENLGVSMTTASNAALIVASFPAVTLLFESFLYRSKPTLRKVSGILTALAGVAVLTQITIEGSPKSLIGNMLLLGAGAVWAFYNFISRKLTGKYSAVTLTYYQMLSGAFLFLPFVLIEGGTWHIPNAVSLGALVYLSVGCSFAAFMLYNLGLRKLTASVSVSLMNLVPVFGLILSVLILGESVHMLQIFGGVIVVLGVVLSSVDRQDLQSNTAN